MSTPVETGPPAILRGPALPWVLLVLVGAAALLGFWWLGSRSGAAAQGPTLFTVAPPEGGRFYRFWAPLADIAPDGASIVFAAVDADGTRRLYHRRFDEFEARPVAGTEGAEGPFFSSDGWVGFVARGKLKRTMPDGLKPATIVDVADAFGGGSWAPDGSVIFNGDFDTGLERISVGASTPESLTTPDRERGEKIHTQPYVLPSGRGVVFTVGLISTAADPEGDSEVAVLSFETGEWSTLIERASGPFRYASGHLLMVRAGRLIALPFDENTLEKTAPPFVLFEDDSGSGLSNRPTTIAVAGDTLVYTDVQLLSNQGVVRVDRDGAETRLIEGASFYLYPELSPDGTRLALTQAGQIWVYELEGGRRLRLTSEGGSWKPIWNPAGDRLVFGSYQPDENLHGIPADGSGSMELLLEHENRQYPLDWHEATGRIVVQWNTATTGYDIWTMESEGDRSVSPFLASRYSERWASLSPDGRWIAFASDESGRFEIYIQAFPDGGAKYAVSTQGGIEPRWSPRGDEIFYAAGGEGELYRAGAELMAVPVATNGERPSIGTATPLFRGDYVVGSCCGHTYDVTPDAQGFVMIRGIVGGSPERIHVIRNGLAALLADR